MNTNHNANTDGETMEAAEKPVANGNGAVGNRSDRSLAEAIKEVVPWHEPVNGEVLLKALEEFLTRHVILPKWAADTLALWCLHTYAFELREVGTYIGLESPEKRCGKTTLLNVLSRLVRRPVTAANISSPAFFRVIEEACPTLLIDEADTFLRGNSELKGILNAGYHRESAYVLRVFSARGGEGREGDENATTLGRFSCWCPKLMCMIGRLPDTLADRCIVIRMHRKIADEKCERLRKAQSETAELRRKCARFAADHAREIAAAAPVMPTELHDRAEDVWEPLVCLADMAGGDWPERARQAAIGLTMSAQENCPIENLLMDSFVLFTELKAERLFSRELAARLDRYYQRPWMEGLKGKPVTEAWLAKQLRPYGMRPMTIRIGEKVGRGYESEDFVEALRRYVPSTEAKAMLKEAYVPPPPPDL